MRPSSLGWIYVKKKMTDKRQISGITGPDVTGERALWMREYLDQNQRNSLRGFCRGGTELANQTLAVYCTSSILIAALNQFLPGDYTVITSGPQVNMWRNSRPTVRHKIYPHGRSEPGCSQPFWVRNIPIAGTLGGLLGIPGRSEF